MLVDELLGRSAARFPDKVGVVAGSRRCSYREIDDRANHLAPALSAAGLRAGDRVAIILDNPIDVIVSMFAVLKAGGIFFIPGRVRPDRLDQLLRDSDAAWQLTADSLRDLENSAASTAVWRRNHRAGSDVAALIYTSGSTGEPKGVTLTHANITFAAASICTYLENTPDDVILNVLPLSFTYGLSQVMTAFHVGATLVFEPSFAYPAAVLDTMARERVTGFPLVPTIATMLLQQDVSSRRFPALRYITNAAAALSTAKLQRLQAVFPGVKIYSMYGLTECRVCYLPPEQLNVRPNSVGIPIPGTDAFVVDEHGRRVAPGVVGELVVCGPHVMSGYWKKLDATTRALRIDPETHEHVLYTGDLFRMDAEGFLYFVDRKDDVIKTRGEKVAPRQVEDAIAQLQGVAEVAVYAIPDELLGEAVAATITTTPGSLVTSDTVKRHCLQTLEPFMVPTVVEIRRTLPMTNSGKVSRRQLQAFALSARGAIA